MADDPRLRAADSDRERAADLLRRHHQVGRLDVEEFEERLQGAYHARTFGDLDELFGDLPPLPLTPSAPAPMALAPGPPPVAGTGRRGFTYVATIDGDPELAIQHAEQRLRGEFGAAAFDLVARYGDRVEFRASRMPGWAWPIVVLTFPVGLLALMIKTEDRVTLEFEPDGGGRTRMVAFGVAPKRVRQALAAFAA